MTRQHLRPLEYLLQLICTEVANFPTSENHFEKYSEILKQLRKDVYGKVNSGLAAMSDISGLYTDHSGDHFDEVVLHAGFMLGLYRNANAESIKDDVISGKWLLTPYEIYILLLCIRFHDVGNIYGRERHEQHINKTIQKFEIVHLKKDRIEANMIASIAGAHGGKTPNGDKDTIGKLQQSENNGHIFDIDNKKIAAITRFADEICENRQRVDTEGPEIPDHNLVFHKYAAAIFGNSIKSNSLCLKLQFKIGDLQKSYFIYGDTKDDKIDVTLPDITLSRLKKAELERRYCNRFMPEAIQIKEISVAIEIIEDEQDEESFRHEVLDQLTFTLKEEGYPLLKDDLMFDEKTKQFMSYDRICSQSAGGNNQ